MNKNTCKKIAKKIYRLGIKIRNYNYLIIKKYHYKRTKVKNNYILFETEGDFCDNGKALYDYMIEKEYNKDYHITWIVSKPRKYKKSAPENVKFISRTKNNIHSKWIFYKTINQTKWFFFTHPYWLEEWKKEQVVINLWHGTPIKAGGQNLSHLFNYVTVASNEAGLFCNKFFKAKESQWVLTGYARNDLLYEKKEEIREKLNIKVDEKIIICMPTYKRNGDQKDSEDDEKYIIPTIINKAELEKLNKYLEKQKIKLIVKIHHLQNINFIEKKSTSNIIYLEDLDLEEQNIDLYHLLGESDALLTDFSSVYFDYLLLDRPIGFFTINMNSYKEKRGFLVDNIKSIMCGEKISNTENLYNFINDLVEGKDNYQEERKIIRDKMNLYQDNNSRERILEIIKEGEK